MYLNYDLKPSIFGKFIFYTRLFANLMAGHTLLRVITMFCSGYLLLGFFILYTTSFTHCEALLL